MRVGVSLGKIIAGLRGFVASLISWRRGRAFCDWLHLRGASVLRPKCPGALWWHLAQSPTRARKIRTGAATARRSWPVAPVACSGLRRDVLNVHAIGEFDQTHFYVAGLGQLTGSGHHAFKPRLIGGDQRRVVTGR